MRTNRTGQSKTFGFVESQDAAIGEAALALDGTDAFDPRFPLPDTPAFFQDRLLLDEYPGSSHPDSFSTEPAVPLTRTRVPSGSDSRAPRTAMTAGMPTSRAVTAPWDSGPPLSVTTARAL